MFGNMPHTRHRNQEFTLHPLPRSSVHPSVRYLPTSSPRMCHRRRRLGDASSLPFVCFHFSRPKGFTNDMRPTDFHPFIITIANRFTDISTNLRCWFFPFFSFKIKIIIKQLKHFYMKRAFRNIFTCLYQRVFS